jgi:hypothetical protein
LTLTRGPSRDSFISFGRTCTSETDSFIGRVAGEEIKSIFGSNFRNVPMSELYPTESLATLSARSKRVMSEPAFFHGSGLVFRHLRRTKIGERIIVPFAPTAALGGGIWGATEYPCRVGKSSPEVELSGDVETWFSV